MSRSMVKFIHADGFYDEESIPFFLGAINNLPRVQKEYGEEVENINLIIPKMEPLFSKVLGERVKIDRERSGIFRKPINNLIHFEDFESSEEWCFIASLEKNEFNIYHHISEPDKGEFSEVDSSNVYKGYKFNYRNLFEWKIHTNVILQPNDGIFIRPWMFHSLNDSWVQYYRLIADKKFRILIMGENFESRKKVSEKLIELIPNSELLVSIDLRIKEKDIDYSEDGQLRQAYRVLDYARDSKKDFVIINMKCPIPQIIDILCSDVLIWMNDNINITNNKENSFIAPKHYDLKFNTTDGIYEEIISKIESKKNEL
jgi:hypothetical protein